MQRPDQRAAGPHACASRLRHRRRGGLRAAGAACRAWSRPGLRLVGPSGPGLSFGLIHCRSQQFTGDRRSPVHPGYGRWWPVVNCGAQYSKACEAVGYGSACGPNWFLTPRRTPLTRWSPRVP
jgi:hypothetical protein